MWMDYELWNVDYIGYAFPIALTRGRFKEGGPMPSMHLDGIGSMNAFAAWYSNYGQEDFSRNALPTWYFGHGTKVKGRASGMDVKQPIGNYVQYRIIQTALWARRTYKITDPRFYVMGNSMGASGNIGLALVSRGTARSYLPLSIKTGSVTRGAKLSRSASGLGGHPGIYRVTGK